MNNQTLLAAGALFSAALFFSPLASANDALSISGSVCDASYGAYVGKIEKSVAGVRNATNTAGVSVNCAIPRDNPLSAQGSFGAKVAVYRASSATIALQCTLNSRTPQGGFVASQTLTFNGVGDNTLNFNAISSVIGGYYVVSCYLPEYSSVRSIFVDEL